MMLQHIFDTKITRYPRFKTYFADALKTAYALGQGMGLMAMRDDFSVVNQLMENV